MASNYALKAIISAVDKLSPTLKGIQKNIRITKKSLGDISNAGGKLLTSIGIGGAALSGGVFGLMRTIVGENSKFEKFETILSTIEGSAETARKSIQWIDKFSNETPYDLDEVTEAYVQLRAYGIDPTNGSLRSVGDAAAGMGKNIMDVVGALSSAMVGESESLKSFGITAKKTGDTIAYSWSENGKKMVAKANANNRDQIEAVVTGIWNRRYGGAMEKLSSTWEGQLSMIKGYALNFARWIGERGLFDKLKLNLQSVIDRFAAWEKDGTLDRLATEISQNLGQVIDQLGSWLRQINWAEVWEGLKSTIVGIKDFINAMGGLKTVMMVVAGLMVAGPVAAIFQIISAVWSLNKMLFGMVFTWDKVTKTLILTNPVMLAIVAAVALIAGAAYLIYKNWDPIKKWFSDLWENIKLGAKMLWDGLITFLSWNPLSLVLKAWGGVAKFFGKLYDQAHGIREGGPIGVRTETTGLSNGPTLSPRAQSMSRSRVDGEMTVKFENAPAGTRVSQGTTNTPGMSFNADVGYRPFATPF